MAVGSSDQEEGYKASIISTIVDAKIIRILFGAIRPQ